MSVNAQFDSKTSKKRLKEILEILMASEVAKSLTPKKLSTLLKDLGPSFIKLGKIMASRQNILPDDYKKELENLNIESASMNYEEIKKFLEKEYGLPIDEIFLEIDETPICVSSISQSHRATLKDGPQIIIKIQKPEIYQSISTDISLIKKTLGILNLETAKNSSSIDLNYVFDELWNICQKETNYLLEAENIETFYKLNKISDFIVSPKVYPKYTTANVLAVEYIDGVSLENISSDNTKNQDLTGLAYTLLDNYIKQVLKDGFFNANPIAKNILIKNGKIAWINLNLVGILSKEDIENVKKLFVALKNDDIAELKNILLSEINNNERVNNSKIYSGLESIVAQKNSEDISHSFSKILTDIINLLKENGVSLKESFLLLFTSFIILGNTIKFLDPNLNMFNILFSDNSNFKFSDDIKISTEKESVLKKNTSFIESPYKKDIQTVPAGTSVVISQTDEKTIDMISQISDILKMAVDGETKLNLKLAVAEESVSFVDKIVNKLILCLISVGLLIGACSVMSMNIGPKLLGVPVIGASLFIAAIILIIYLVIKITRKKQ